MLETEVTLSQRANEGKWTAKENLMVEKDKYKIFYRHFMIPKEKEYKKKEQHDEKSKDKIF